MEVHFPHLTNGIAAPKRIKKRNHFIPLMVVALVSSLVFYIAF